MSWIPYTTRLEYDAVSRPSYGFCIYNAALLAVSLGYPKISVIEFGVAGGNGLVNIEWHVQQIKKVLEIDIEVYGFDLETGLPRTDDYRDMPYMWAEGFFRMDRKKLEARLGFAKLVIGDIRDTCSTFVDDFDPAPLGCAFFDLDYYSSTVEAFKIFDSGPDRYLPRVYCYFDDIFSGGQRANNEFVGELKAISEFNDNNSGKKIASISGLVTARKVPAYWNQAIYAFHDFEHPRYCDFIGNALEQVPLR